MTKEDEDQIHYLCHRLVDQVKNPSTPKDAKQKALSKIREVEKKTGVTVLPSYNG